MIQNVHKFELKRLSVKIYGNQTKCTQLNLTLKLKQNFELESFELQGFNVFAVSTEIVVEIKMCRFLVVLFTANCYSNTTAKVC